MLPHAVEEAEDAGVDAALRPAIHGTTKSSMSVKKPSAACAPGALLTLLPSSSATRDSSSASTRKIDGTIEMVIARLGRRLLDPHTSRRAAKNAGGHVAVPSWWGAAVQRVAPCSRNKDRGTRAPCDVTSRGCSANDAKEHSQEGGQRCKRWPVSDEAAAPLEAACSARGDTP